MRTAVRSAGVLLIEIALLAVLFSYLASRQGVDRAVVPPGQGPVTALPATSTIQLSERKLKESQDAYLEMLMAAPSDRSAMRGLVLVRRRLAGDDPMILRKQAAIYRQAIATGVEIADEHYTSAAMTILADASTLAAHEIESKKKPSATIVMGTRPPAVARTVGPATAPRRPQTIAQRARVTVKSLPPIGSVEPPSHRTWRHQRAKNPDLDERRGPHYRIQVGPVLSLEHATAVTAILKQAGYTPRLSKSIEPGVTNFQVVSEVISRRVGETRATALTELGFRAQVRSVSPDRVQLHFGTFLSRSTAMELTRRIRATGYWAGVGGGNAAGYVIVLGPHGRTIVDAITGIFMARSRITSPVTVIPAE